MFQGVSKAVRYHEHFKKFQGFSSDPNDVFGSTESRSISGGCFKGVSRGFQSFFSRIFGRFSSVLDMSEQFHGSSG